MESREMLARYDFEDSVKYDVLVNYLLDSMKDDYISIENLKKLLRALGIEERNDNNE